MTDLAVYQVEFPAGDQKVINPDGTLNNASPFLRALFFRTGAGTGLPQVDTGIEADGASQATAQLLMADWNSVDTVAGGSGVVMPPLQQGQAVTVLNTSATPLAVYPPDGFSIDALGVNADYSLAAGKEQTFKCWTLTEIRSTQLG
jgi:hypothetical protein